jgi:mRNA interferase MazF
VGMEVARFEIFLVRLDPTEGSEIRKTRPCVVISPDEMNAYARTIMLAPMTTVWRDFPARVNVVFRGKRGQVVLDQIRTVDKGRLVKKLGKLEPATASGVLDMLAQIFAP